METKITCPHCGKEFGLDVEVRPSTVPDDKPTGKRTTFDQLLAWFNRVLSSRGYNEVKPETSTWNYLLWAFNFAMSMYNDDNEWVFKAETYPLVFDYRGSQYHDNVTAYNAMQAWLMASILAELVPDSGTETNTQTELFMKAYEIGGGCHYPLYSGNMLKEDPYAMREAASIIYAICRSDKYVTEHIETCRRELGGKPIPATVWEDLGYENEMISDDQGRKGYETKNIGYLVNTEMFLPDAPAPRVEGTTVCDLPWPQDLGQGIEQFNPKTGNYLVDEDANNWFVQYWNMMSMTPLSVWEGYSIIKRNRLVNVAATPPCTYQYMFGAPKRVRFDGIMRKTYDGVTYADYYTFSETKDDTGLVLDGPFSDLAGIYRYDVMNKNARELFIESITAIADNFRFPTQDPNYGRCRAGCKPTREGGELNPVHGAAENEIYNVDLTAMVADTERQKENLLHEDGFAADSPRSYVSGHSAQIWMLALMLTQMDQDSTDRPKTWVRKAYEYSVNRTIGRFHWNSDIVYGRLFGAMCLPILNAMTGLKGGYEATRAFVQNQEPTDDFRVNIIIKNETGEDIKSTGEIRVYVEDHIGINTYLPDAWSGAGALYWFVVGETDFSDQDVHCELNGDDVPPTDYVGDVINGVRFYDDRHWKNTDAGYKAELDLTDPRCDNIIQRKESTYVIKITKL